MANLSVHSSDILMLNKEQWVRDICVVIYLGVMMLFGTVGNAFVSYIYYFKLDNTVSNLFVAVLSFCDLFGCLICIPLDIVVILHPYTFYSDPCCRFIRFLVMDNAVISAAIVFAISVDRFKKIALPLGEQMTPPQVVKICVIIAILSTIVSLPCFYVYAAQEVTTYRLNITGMQCTLSSMVKGLLGYIIFVIVMSVIITVALCTIYSLVWIKLYRYKKQRVILQNSSSKTISSSDMCAVIESFDYINEHQRFDKKKKGQPEIDPVLLSPPLWTVPTTEKLHTSFVNMSRTTLIMCLVSFFGVLSFMPHNVAIAMLVVRPNLKHTLGHTEHALLGIGLRSFYFNNAANPWIYGIFNDRFRQEVFSLLRKAACR